MVPLHLKTDQPSPSLCFPAGFGSGIFRILAVGLVFYGTSAVLTIALSCAGLIISALISWAILVAAGASAYYYYRWIRGDAGKSLFASREPGVRLLLPAGLIFYLLLWVLAYILPDAENDGLWYHNPTLHFWALKGRIHWITVDPEPFWNDLIDYAWNGYLKGVELFGFLLLRATRINRLLNAVNLTLIPLGCLGIAALARLLGAGKSMATLAGVLFLFVPNVICHAVNFYIDAGVASFYIALLAVTAFTIRSLEAGSYPAKLLPALGIALGLAISAKGTAVVLLPSVPIVLGFFLVRAVRSGRSTVFARRRATLFIVLIVIIAIIVGGFWYLRNYLHTGSPLYPIGLRLAGRTIFPGVEIPFQFPPPNTPVNRHWPQLFRVLYSWLDSPDDWRIALTEVSHNSGGIGLLWLFGCLPAITWLLWQIIRRRVTGRQSGVALSPRCVSAWIGILIVGAVIFFAMPPRHNHKARYIIWLYGIGLPSFAFVAERVWRVSTTLRRGLARGWIIMVILIFLAEGLYSFFSQVRRISFYRQGVREGSFQVGHLLRAAVEPYPPGFFFPAFKETIFQRILPYAESVALGELNKFPAQKEILGHLTQGDAFGKRPIYFLDRETAGNPEKLARFLGTRGIKYVIWNTDIPVPQALGKSACLWDRIPYWYYVLVVNPDSVRPADPGEGQSP